MVGARAVETEPVPPGAAALADDLRQILAAASRGARLTGQLLAFARKQVIAPAVLDLNGLVTESLDMLRRLLGEDVEVVWIPAPGLGCVKADRGQIEQVIMNLAVNARDAMPEGGALTIALDNVEVDEEYCRGVHGSHPGSFVCLSVEDTGCGMDQETLGLPGLRGGHPDERPKWHLPLPR